MKIEVEVNGKTVIVACPFCTDPAHPPPDPRLIEAGRFHCPGCQREFVALNPCEYADAITAVRPALLVGEILRRL